MHRLIAKILDASNSFRNKNGPILNISCVIPPTYYLEFFEKLYPSIPLY